MPEDSHRNLKRYSIAERRSLVRVEDFAKIEEPTVGFTEFVASLPDMLAGRQFKELIAELRRIAAEGDPIAVAFGAHVIKCGLSPIIIDLIDRRIIRAVAATGACAVHDWEIAFVGKTSEDIAEALPQGRFGMAVETVRALAQAARTARKEQGGFGESLGAMILEDELQHADKSIFAAAARAGIPATVHVAIGTDVVHMHPEADGADIGAASLADFRKICDVVAGLGKGAWLNVGSAVVLPEVFLKAVAVARNGGVDLDGMITANFDMYDLYRPRTNVVNRPSAKGFSIIGRHEIMLPLLRMALVAPQP